MIFGSVTIDAQAVQTHRDSYRLPTLTVVSARRPLLGTALLFAVGLGGFALAFADLLYANEVLAIIGAIVLTLIAGVAIGQLKLLSRDLRGSELSGAVWGSYGHLNRIRREIVAAMLDADAEVVR